MRSALSLQRTRGVVVRTQRPLRRRRWWRALLCGPDGSAVSNWRYLAVQEWYLRTLMSAKYGATIDAAQAQRMDSLFACWLTMATCSRRLLGCEQITTAPQQ